eukprot:scaffold139293_cov148-Phaeocystis_antarctica.AAC.1
MKRSPPPTMPPLIWAAMYMNARVSVRVDVSAAEVADGEGQNCDREPEREGVVDRLNRAEVVGG